MKEINYSMVPDRGFPYSDLNVAKYVPVIREQIQALSNDDLFWNYTNLLPGDDYDGCFTNGGRIAIDELQDELLDRLVASGFLSQKEDTE